MGGVFGVGDVVQEGAEGDEGGVVGEGWGGGGPVKGWRVGFGGGWGAGAGAGAGAEGGEREAGAEGGRVRGRGGPVALLLELDLSVQDVVGEVEDTLNVGVVVRGVEVRHVVLDVCFGGGDEISGGCVGG